jgi:hypothetical protein
VSEDWWVLCVCQKIGECLVCVRRLVSALCVSQDWWVLCVCQKIGECFVCVRRLVSALCVSQDWWVPCVCGLCPCRVCTWSMILASMSACIFASLYYCCRCHHQKKLKAKVSVQVSACSGCSCLIPVMGEIIKQTYKYVLHCVNAEGLVRMFFVMYLTWNAANRTTYARMIYIVHLYMCV